MESITSPAFHSDLQFCPVCGSVLPLSAKGESVIPCSRCPFKRNLKDLDDVVEEFIIHFNSSKKKKKKSLTDRPEEGEAEAGQSRDFIGPTVERQCPRCRHDTMTYTTRQTRSADEGQTVFYTCLACRFQDIEYS